MKIRILRIPALLILLICCCVSALCEEAGRVTLVPGEECPGPEVHTTLSPDKSG